MPGLGAWNGRIVALLATKLRRDVFGLGVSLLPEWGVRIGCWFGDTTGTPRKRQEWRLGVKIWG